MKKCKGCGILMQTSDPKLSGYTPKENSDYCQRCFRLTHYDDLMYSMKKGIDPDAVLDQIVNRKGLIVWVVDLFDFEANLIEGLNRKLNGRDIILAGTKKDLLPETLKPQKIADFIFSRLKDENIRVKELVLLARNDQDGLEDLWEAIEDNRKGQDVILMGRANAGKSTLLNRLMAEDALTISRYPGTTLDFNEMDINGIHFIDTPGIEIDHSILMNVDESELKTIIPSTALKPTVFQLKGDQSFAIGGLARIDLKGCEKASCVFYCSDRLQLQRSKLENADALWEKHYGKMLKPVATEKQFARFTTTKKDDKMDVVIDGLGWACISGTVQNVTVHVPKGVGMTFRKAMI